MADVKTALVLDLDAHRAARDAQGRGAAVAEREPPLRRIWHVDPEALATVLALLVGRAELEDLLWFHGGDDAEGWRTEALYRDAVTACRRPCRFAEEVEALVDRRTRMSRERLRRSPMIDLARVWAGARAGVTGEDLAAFYWGLVGVESCAFDALARKVAGEIWFRALGELVKRGEGEGQEREPPAVA
jgi:hypothetical protein